MAYFAIHETLSDSYLKEVVWEEGRRKYSAVFVKLDSRIKRKSTLKKAEATIRWIINNTGFDFPDTLEVVQLLEPIQLDDDVKPADVEEKGPEAPAEAHKQDCLKCPYFLDKPAEAVRDKSEPEELPPLYPVTDNDKEYWEIIAFVGEKKKPPLMLRKQFARTYSYAIKMPDGGFFYLPGDELLAWERYYDECKKFVCGRIRERRIREGRDPGGMDEWRR